MKSHEEGLIFVWVFYARLIRQAYLEIAMIYSHSSENAPSDPVASDLPPLSEREDSMSMMDDASSVMSGITIHSSIKSGTKAKKKVLPACLLTTSRQTGCSIFTLMVLIEGKSSSVRNN